MTTPHTEPKTYTHAQWKAAYQEGRDSMKAEWVGLADYEITACLRNSSWPDIAKAIESKLREKNST